MKTTRKKVARIGTVETLESRVVMTSRAQIVVNDVTAFFANYAATVPALVTNVETTAAIVKQAGSNATAAQIAAARTASTTLTGTITTDVNNLGTNLLKDLGSSAAGSIRLSVTGATTPTTVVFSPTGSASPGSLMNALLQVDKNAPAALGGASGLNLAADLSIGTSYAVSIGHGVFPLTPFGNFTASHFSNILPLANKLANDRMTGGFGTTVIAQDIAAINTQTINDVNGLATTLVKQLGPGSTAGVGSVITGVTTSSSVVFQPNQTPAFGSLLASLQALGSNTNALTSPDILIGIVNLYAFI